MEPTQSKVLAALSRAQSKFETVRRDAENPAFKRAGKVSRYATLESVIEAVRPALQSEGLVLVQKNIYVNGFFGVETRLVHLESGEETTSQFIAPLEKQNAQGVASILTYARRYEYFTLLGLVSEDDDGNAASGVSPLGGKPVQTRKTQKSTNKASQNDPETASAGSPAPEDGPVAPSVSETNNNPSICSVDTKTTPEEAKAYIERAKAVGAKLVSAGMQPKGALTVGGQLVKFITSKTGYESLAEVSKEKWDAIIVRLESAVETNAKALIQIIQETE
jgi:hypothetical protein